MRAAVCCGGRPVSRSLRSAGTLGILFTLTSGALLLSGCSSSPRSISAYCTTFYQKGTQFRNEYLNTNASADPLGAIVAIVTAPSQLADFFGELDAVAPSSIEPDIAQIHGAFKKEVDGATGDLTNPVGGLLNGLASAIETGPAWNAVNSWTESNCGPPPGTKWLSGSQGS